MIDYLRAAITRTTLNALPALTLASAPVPPLADLNLLAHRRLILKLDFPLLNTSQVNVEQNQITTQLRILIQDNGAEQRCAEQLRQDTKREILPTS